MAKANHNHCCISTEIQRQWPLGTESAQYCGAFKGLEHVCYNRILGSRLSLTHILLYTQRKYDNEDECSHVWVEISNESMPYVATYDSNRVSADLATLCIQSRSGLALKNQEISLAGDLVLVC
jgi:hypothetical protein